MSRFSTRTTVCNSNDPSEFQDIRFKIAKMASEIEAARQLNYYVCDQIDQGGRATKASMIRGTRPKWLNWSPAILCRFGWYRLYPYFGGRYWRDARLTKIFEGTSKSNFTLFRTKSWVNLNSADGRFQGNHRHERLQENKKMEKVDRPAFMEKAVVSPKGMPLMISRSVGFLSITKVAR